MTTWGHAKSVIKVSIEKYPDEPKTKNKILKKGWRNATIKRKENRQ